MPTARRVDSIVSIPIGSKVEPLTREERLAVASLERLSRRWPKTLWIYATGSPNGICLMKAMPDTSRPELPFGGVDRDYLIGFVKIPNDGGDW